jgi:hypothetical protein
MSYRQVRSLSSRAYWIGIGFSRSRKRLLFEMNIGGDAFGKDYCEDTFALGL